MKTKYFFLIAIFILFLMPLIYATCTITLDKSDYLAGETATAAMSCSEPGEKNTPYNVNWTNSSGYQYELDGGTTPATKNQLFYQSFDIPTNWDNGVSLNVSLNGTGLTVLQNDTANVTSTGFAASTLVITDSSVGGKWLGLQSSVQGTVKDSNGKLISGGKCIISVWSNDETTMQERMEAIMIGGEVKANWIMDYSGFSEATDYAVKLRCYCGSEISEQECTDEDGAVVDDASGVTTVAFTTNRWATVRNAPFPITYENGTLNTGSIFAGFGEKVFFRTNLTNNGEEDLVVKATHFLIDNSTGAIFSGAKEGVYVRTVGNSSSIVGFEIDETAPSGDYYIRNIFNIYYNNLLVTQGIANTAVFTVIGTDNSFILENVITNKENYYTGESIHVCINLTNNYNKRVEFDVLYNFRCGESNSDASTERSLVGEHRELRALSAGTTQNQCAELYTSYPDHLLYKTTQCYASVTIESPYINTFDNKKSITSPVFNLVDFGMYPEYELNPAYPIVRLFPDWRRFDNVIDNVTRSYFRAKINITKLNETRLDPNGAIDDDKWDVYTLFSDKMPCSTDIYNYTVELANGTQVNNPIENKAVTWKKNENGEKIENYCAIGIENVNFTDIDDDYFIVKVWYENLEERATEALEGINSKTGTFHMDVDCPSTGTKGNDIDCIITAQIEESQEVEKEVDFTCYIVSGTDQYSSVNFNQMVTKTPVSITRAFSIPAILTTGSQYVLQCHGDYYNLGSRRDSFYDTFTVSESSGRGSSGGSGITGGAVGEEDEGEDGIEKIKKKIDDIIKKINPFNPETKPAILWIEAIISLIVIGILISRIIGTRKCPVHQRKSPRESHQRIEFNESLMKIFKSLFILIGIAAGIGLIAFAYKSLKSVSINPSLIQDPLIRDLILIGAIVGLAIILFKSLHIRGEISFGKDPHRPKFHHDQTISRLQNKINRHTLRQELKNRKTPKHLKIKKIRIKRKK
jgi:hypothetical protein